MAVSFGFRRVSRSEWDYLGGETNHWLATTTVPLWLCEGVPSSVDAAWSLSLVLPCCSLQGSRWRRFRRGPKMP